MLKGLKNYSILPEGELLTLLAADNKLAFRQLYISYYSRIYSYALKFIKSSELAEDIAQEVFISVWENRRSLATIQCLKAYLFTSCKNRTLNMLTHAAREMKIKQQILTSSPYFHSDTENKMQCQEYEQLLNQAIEQLSPQRRQVFRLCKIEGKTYEEAACKLGVSVGTVNDHIVKATRSIREYLLKYNITLSHVLLFYLLYSPD